MAEYLVPTLAEAKRYWKTGGVKSKLTKEAQRFFRMGQKWLTTKGGYPAVVSHDPDGQGSYIIAFRITASTGRIHAVQSP